jgi:hypothetical protein
MTAPRSTRAAVAKKLGVLALACCAASAAQAYQLKIESLTLNRATAIEHTSVTGDDRGGIAFANGSVYYTGDASTGRFLGTDLSSNSKLGTIYDGMFSTFSDGKLYTMTDADASPYTYNAGFGRVELFGAPGTSVALSQKIGAQLNRGGMFSGYDAGYKWDRITQEVMRIDPRTGAVTLVGKVALDSATSSENWAFWGIAEHFGNQDYLTYTTRSGIKRTRISDGFTEQLLTANLGEMAAFTIDPATNKWFFHVEGASVFRSGDETIGSADARISLTIDAPAPAPSPVPEPASLLLLGAGLLGAAAARQRKRA